MANEIIFKTSNQKILWLIIGALGFVLLGIFLLFFPFGQAKLVSGNAPSSISWVGRGAGLAGIIFFGLCFLAGIYMLTSRKPGLIINDEGIIDHSSYVGVGLTKWENINRIEAINVCGTPLIFLYLNRPEEPLEKAPAWQKFWLKRNLTMFGTPLSISATTLNCTFQQLLAAVTEKFNAIKSTSNPSAFAK